MSYQMNPIESYTIYHDIHLMVEKAENFGKDIADAFVRLAEKLANNGQKRECYGIVLNDNSGMSYYAGMTELYAGENKEKSIYLMTIPAGDYRAIKVENWNQNILHIGPTFDQILTSGQVEANAPCIEYYRTETELLCMIRAK